MNKPIHVESASTLQNRRFDSVRRIASINIVPATMGYHFSSGDDNHDDANDSNEIVPDPVTPLLLTIQQVAEILSISVRHVRSLHARGQLPRPLRLGRAVRWDRSELIRWLEAGAPERSRWESLKRQS